VGRSKKPRGKEKTHVKSSLEHTSNASNRFQRIFESENVAVGCWKAEGTCSDANNALLRLIGYTREDLEAGKVRWTDLTPPEFAHLDSKALVEIQETGRCAPFEKEYIRKDGTRIPILITGTSFGEGITDAGPFLALDLTEKKSIENAKESQTRILSSILLNMEVGIVAADKQGQIVLVNQAAEKIMGIGQVKAAPEDWSQMYGFYLPDEVTLYEPENLPLARAIRGESVFSAEVFVRNEKTPQGTWISATAQPLRDEAGALVGAVLIFHDITAKKMETLRKRSAASSVQHRINLLTIRERQIMQLLAAGESAKHIAHLLSISPKTVDNHRAKILEKMQVDNPTQLARLASLVEGCSEATSASQHDRVDESAR
jgi:PAS domain S-box-containing protein